MSVYVSLTMALICVIKILWVSEWVSEWVYECISVWVYEYMSLFVCVWVYNCMNVWVYKCMNVWVYECMSLFVCVWVYKCVSVWVYEVCMSACVYDHMSVCIHLHFFLLLWCIQKGYTAIHVAARKGYIDILRTFLDHDVDANIRTEVSYLSYLRLLFIVCVLMSFFVFYCPFMFVRALK